MHAALSLDHSSELHALVLQPRDDALILRDLILHVAGILRHACLDVLGPIRVLQRIVRLLET